MNGKTKRGYRAIPYLEWQQSPSRYVHRGFTAHKWLQTVYELDDSKGTPFLRYLEALLIVMQLFMYSWIDGGTWNDSTTL